MATLLHGESRRMYSWWWDSHISPKNSKWLQDNLTDMDRNVKAMIKLIEEDADSFARRAEMYYKKRPELMKLVEEFYRAYRALAERYDHATGALRQAHRTMAEAFPNQIPPIMSDESPSSSGTEFGPHTPEMPSPMRAPLDPDDLQKVVLGVSSNFHARGRNGSYSEESESLSSKKGLKQLKEMFPSGEGVTRAMSEGKVRKVLNFKEEEGKIEEKDDLKNEIKRLQGEVSQLTTRNDNLMTQMASESQHARTLEETIAKLEAVKEAALLQYKLSIQRMSSLETDICNARDELNNVNNEMVVKLNSIEEQCLAMEKVNKSLQLELENQQKELEKRGRELEELNTLIEAEHQKRMQAEVSLEQIHTHSQEEAELLVLEIQRGSKKLKETELNKVGLEEKISELNKIIGNLHEQNISSDLKIKNLQDEMKLLKETKEELEHELGVYMEERKALQDELFCLKEDQRDLEQRNRGLTEQMEVVSEKNVVLENFLSDANVELEGLREKANALDASCETLLCEVSTHAVEKGVLVSQIEIISQNMERLSEKNTSLENSLSDANAELEVLRARFKDMKECCMSLCDQNSSHLAEKNALVSQVENLENKYLELQNQHLILEKEKDSKVHQVMELQCSLTLEKQGHEALLLSSSSQLASLHNQINLLEEQLCIKMEDFELEQQKVMNSLLEIFILKSCLREMNDKNLFLFGECQNLLEASKCTESQISQLMHTQLMQKEELTSLSECNGILTEGIHLLLEALKIDVNQRTSSDIPEEVLLQTILAEIKNLLNSLSDTQDENRQIYLQVVNIETRCVSLQDQLANLEKEKDSAIHQVMDFKSSLRLGKEEHEALILSSSSQLASLQNQIHLLQEEIQVRDEELEVEQQNTIKAHLENFVLQRCLCDMKDNNLFLSEECQNLLQARRCAEKQISELEHKGLIQNEELTLLSNLSNNLRAGIHLLLEALNLDIKKGTKDDPTDEAVLETISGGIRNLLSSSSDAHDENQCLHLELLVLVTLIKQIGVDNFQLHHELESQTKELLALSSEKLKLMEMCKQLEDENNIHVSKVETSKLSLEMLETEYAELEDKNLNLQIKSAELEDKNLNLEREKDLFLHQILELENSLELEKQEHHALISSSKNQIASLATQLDLQQVEWKVKEDEFEREQQKASYALLENFILQRCLNDMKDRNLILFEECQKLLDASRCSDKLISEVQHECLTQQKEMKLISDNNEKLRNGVLLILMELNINMDCGTIDGTKDEVMLQTLLDEIKIMLNSVSNVQEESQCLGVEISVLGTLLKEIGLEKVRLYYELGSRNEEVLSLQEKKDEAMEKNEQLIAEMQILVEQLSDLQASHQTSQTEIHNLHKMNQSLSKTFYYLKEKMVALEEGNSDILAEALTLDHLFIFFKAQNTERGLKLKLLSDNICSILAVKNGLDVENRVQNERIRKLEVQTMNLNDSAILQEFDLNMARNFCEEFNLQIEASENLLLQKEMKLSEAQEENTELCRKLESVNKDLDGAIVMQRELKREINTLSLGIVSKEGEITEILEANRFLHKELDRLNFEVEVLRQREEYLTSELQKGLCEVNKCEGEIQTLLDGIHISTVNATISEEKLLEQIVACESLQTVSMLQREMLGEAIALKNACADELKKELDNLEGENGTLKADLNAYSPLLMSLFDGVACVEELIFSLAKLQDKQVNDTSDAPESKKSSHQPSKNDSTSATAGFLDMQKLIAKVEALQKVIIDSTNLLQQERLDSNAKIEAARKEIEQLKLKEILLQEKSKEKYGQIMKDIQLDQVSRSRVSSYSTNRNESGESDDQMLELWETAERDDIEAVEEVKSEHPSSELIAEKELSIDKLEVSTIVNESSPRVWNKKFIEKLDSDAQRLSVLQRSLQELKTKLESSEEKKHPNTSEYGTLKAQLREAEEAILEQIDMNGNLKKKVEDNFESSDAVIWEKERRQVSEQAKRGSEKIAKLELELQKIEYIFLKVEEEEENMRTGCVDRKSSTLRDFISGKRDGKGKRKGRFCGCMRPKTKA